MAASRPLPLSEIVPGTIIANRYTVTEILGRGGMGLVVKASDQNLDGETVAVKILYPRYATNRTTLTRFRREVLLARRLSHPNIVRLYDLGEATLTSASAANAASSTLHFMTMEYVPGVSAEGLLKQKDGAGLSPQETVRIVSAVAQALACAHKQGIVHRDVKPANILVGENGVVKLMDFGVSRAIDSAEQLTRTNEALGSPRYMSPEQLTAEKIDPTSDLYSLGIVAFELLTGRAPFDANEWMALVQQHMNEPIPAIPQHEALQRAIVRAAAKSHHDRFSDGDAMARAFEAALASSSGAGKVLQLPRIPSALAVAAIAVIVLAGGYVAISKLFESLPQ